MLEETPIADPLFSNFSHPSLMAIVLSAPTGYLHHKGAISRLLMGCLPLWFFLHTLL